MFRLKPVLSWLLAIGTVIALGTTSAFAATSGKAGTAQAGGGIRGQIESVNVDGKTLTLKQGAKEIQVTWTDATKLEWVMGKGKLQMATMTDLKTGERVNVRGEKNTDGSYAATSIWIHKPMDNTKSMPHAPGK